MAGEISFTPTEGDFTDANRDWYLATLRGRRGLLRLAFPILLCTALGGFFTFLGGDLAANPWLLATYALLGVILVIVIQGICYLTLPRQARRLFRQQKSLHQPIRFRWSGEGLGTEAATGSSLYRWEDFHRWFEGRRTFLLFLNDRLFIFLPRHRLDDAAAEELRALVTAAGVRRF